MAEWESLLRGILWEPNTQKKKRPRSELTQQPDPKRTREPSHGETIHAALDGSVQSVQPPPLNPESDRNISRLEQNGGGGNTQLVQTLMNNHDTSNLDPCSSSPSDGRAFVPCEKPGEIDDTTTSGSSPTRERYDAAPDQCLSTSQNESTSSVEDEATLSHTFVISQKLNVLPKRCHLLDQEVKREPEDIQNYASAPPSKEDNSDSGGARETDHGPPR
ncbi:hypothetical protein FSARC_5273 [Fusarium sarcochroum]|uniref:Uncharacterized protein n=1 Tax=Fusarium sarcochroum TaxID=1208366 RepID=A0A8H4X9N7_9HYPO|nr:hypothetical protein FSARC_5273 [Fusarium sarcochroum]